MAVDFEPIFRFALAMFGFCVGSVVSLLCAILFVTGWFLLVPPMLGAIVGWFSLRA